MAYVCFIVDAFSRRFVGWRVAANMKTNMVLDELEMARRSRGGLGDGQVPAHLIEFLARREELVALGELRMI